MYVYGGVDTRDGMCDETVLWAIKPLDSFPQWQPIKLKDPYHILPSKPL